MNAHGPLPLDGVRVIDISSLGPGPFSSMLLADYGADVVFVFAWTVLIPFVKFVGAGVPTAIFPGKVPIDLQKTPVDFLSTHVYGTLPLDLFLARAPAERVAGTAIFLAARTDVTPGPMLHSLKHYHVLHERVVLTSITVEDIPFVPLSRRVEVNKLGKGFFEVKIRFGFFEFPDVPQALERCRLYGLPSRRKAAGGLPVERTNTREK